LEAASKRDDRASRLLAKKKKLLRAKGAQSRRFHRSSESVFRFSQAIPAEANLAYGNNR